MDANSLIYVAKPAVLVKFGANGDIEQALVIGNSTYHDRVVDIE